MNIQQHNIEILRNQKSFLSKPLLKKLYHNFYSIIKNCISSQIDGAIVEIGSGIGLVREIIPQCICTDLFSNPWIDRVENVYSLSFKNNELSHVILFDVFHHLRYPVTALEEVLRVLKPGGRIIIFDPCISFMGVFVWGPFHHESLGLNQSITFNAPNNFNSHQIDYYAASANAYRIFWRKNNFPFIKNIILKKRFSCLSYVLSGGFSKPQLYPTQLFNFIKLIEKGMDYFPLLFATRTLIVMEK